MTTTKNIDPRTWSKQTKTIVAIIVAIIILMSILTTCTGPRVQVNMSNGTSGGNGTGTTKTESCTVATKEIFVGKKAQLEQAIQDANAALASVDASLKPGEGTRLEHTEGFPISSEGQAAITALAKARDNARKVQEPTNAIQCPSDQDNINIDDATKTIKDQTASFVSLRDAYRLNKAAGENNEDNDPTDE